MTNKMIKVPEKWLKGLLKATKEAEKEVTNSITTDEYFKIQACNRLVGYCNSARVVLKS